MSAPETEELRQEIAELRAEIARLREAQANLADHPDFEGFREWSRAIRDRRVNEWSYDIQMWPGAYKLTRIVVISAFLIGSTMILSEVFGFFDSKPTYYQTSRPPMEFFQGVGPSRKE